MAKSGRHKKLSRQEKSKTQLKGVKKLAKATNVVDPTLKIKKILVREQLSNANDGLVTQTRRKQSLQEILSSLNHHNTNIRKDALAGLQELVTDHSVVKHSLDKILDRVAFLTSDLEGSIRRENLKVAEAIFNRVDERHMEPFWELVLTHLKCTLTHLRPTVRYHTLPFLQLLVTNFPNLVTKSYSLILPSLLGLISSSSSGSSSSKNSNPNSSKSNSRLNVDISGKHNEVKERIKVLNLIGSCLQLSNTQQKPITFCSSSSSKGKTLHNKDSISIFSSVSFKSNLEEVGGNNNKSSLSKPKRFLGLYYPMGYDLPGSNISIRGSGRNRRMEMMKAKEMEEGDKWWPRFVLSALNVLTQTWVEAGPSKVASSVSKSLELEPTSRRSNKKSDNRNGNSNKRKKTFNKDDRNGDGGGFKFSKRGFKDDDEEEEDVDEQEDEDVDVEIEIDVVNVDSDKEIMMDMERRASSTFTILNGAGVESLTSIVAVIVPLILHSKSKAEQSNSDQFMRTLRKNHCADLSKYFLSQLPYSAMNEMEKGLVTTLNLQLFMIASQLRLIDEDLSDVLDDFVTEIQSGEELDAEQILLVLKILCCIQQKKQSKLSTRFVCCVLEQKRHWSLMCRFLMGILRLDNKTEEEVDLMDSINWDKVTEKLGQTCNKKMTKEFMTVLTYIGIRRLATNLCLTLKNTISFKTFEDLLDPSTPQDILMAMSRLLWYTNAMEGFRELVKKKFPKEYVEKLRML